MKQRQDWIAVAPPDPGPLQSVSPSQLGSLRRCALSAVWSAQRVPRALPQSPAGLLGTVVHRFLEEVGKGLINDPSVDDLGARWEELVQAADASMNENGLERHLVPLRHSVADYEVRRIQSIRLAREMAKAAPKSPQTKQPGRLSGYEVPVATPDRRVVGRIDELASGPAGAVVRDYKSGAIYREDSMGALTLKDEYAAQLKLYAALVAAMTGKWPTRLEIASLDGSTEAVPVHEDECLALLREAEELLDTTNAIVNSSVSIRDRIGRLARPSASACRFCSYRPICPAYLECDRGDFDTWPRDVFGVVSDVRRLGNGRVLIQLYVGEPNKHARIVGLDPSTIRHPALDSIGVGTFIGVFNLGRAQGPFSFEEGQLTTIYSFDAASQVVNQASKCRPSASATRGGTAFAT